MSIPILLERISKHGLKISVIDDQIKILGSKAGITQSVIDELKANKNEILEYFDKQKKDPRTDYPESSVSYDANCENIRQYTYPDGRVIRVSNLEFENLVRIVKLLHQIDTTNKQI